MTILGLFHYLQITHQTIHYDACGILISLSILRKNSCVYVYIHTSSPTQTALYLGHGYLSHNSVLREGRASHEVIELLAFAGEA